MDYLSASKAMDKHHLLAAGSTSFPICCLSKQSLENAPKGVKGVVVSFLLSFHSAEPLASCSCPLRL
jgi:hypothetical protein